MAYLVPDETTILNGVPVNKYLLTQHNPNNIGLPCKMKSKVGGITIHNTDWIKVNSATTPAEQYTRATVNNNMRDVRVQLYCDNVCGWQNLDWDYENWSCADGRGKGNTTTIAIECIMDGTSNDYNAKSRDNCARLAAYLLWSNGLTTDNLYTHSYWLNVRDGKTGTLDYLNTAPNEYKNCPLYILPNWLDFKELVVQYITELKTINKPIEKVEPQKTKTLYRVQIGAFASLVNANKYKDAAVKAGFTSAYIVKAVVSGKTFYRVQLGAFSVKSNALAYKDKAIKAGFKDALIVT